MFGEPDSTDAAPLLLPVAPMAEDWLDCPALGPGWKRREVFRKSGATCGRSDTYYQSPTGDRIRSKVELTRYLGPACDLTLFDFKQGILCYPAPKAQPLAVPSRKRKKPSRPAKTRKRQVGPQKGEVRKEAPRDETKANADTAPASLPAPGCCENCGISFSGDGTRRQRLKTLCKDCRAQRIAFNREQRMFKRVGCGECEACRVTEDCGACSTCLLQLPHDVASGLFCKCERRRCLRIVERSRGCGVCRGCQTREDCGRCRVCLRPPRPGLRRQWRCVQRRCLRHLAHRLRRHHQRCQRRPPLAVAPPAGKRSRRRGGCDSKMAARRRPPRTQPLPPVPPSQPPESPELHPRALVPSPPAEFIYYCVDEDELQPYTNRRQNRKCGACAACLRRMDCGHCDFCCDKPKFGGSNQKRQKCRWRQCLQFAMKRLLPSVWAGSEDGAGPPPHSRRKRPGSTRRPRPGQILKTSLTAPTARPGHAQTPMKQETGSGFVLPPPGTDLVFLREGASSPVQVPGPAAASTEALLQVKQEKADAQEDWTPGTAILTSPVLRPGCPSKAVDPDLPRVKQEPLDPEEDKEEESKDDSASDSAPEEEAGGAGTPVITEIFSLGGTRLRDTAVWLPRGRERGCWRPGRGRGEDRADSAPRLREEVENTGVYGHHGDGTDFGPSHLPLTLPGAPWQPDLCIAEAGLTGLHSWETAADAAPIPRDSKMYSQRFGITQREVKGPTPKVVIVRAKPPKAQGAEQNLQRIQRSHQKRHAILASIKSKERDRLKVDWDQHSDHKFVDSLVKARIKDAMQGFIINTEERRNKLRELLASEENGYFTEMQLKEETIEEKKDRMKDKTRLLKEKKEKERQDFVAEKLDQQFRECCEELRVHLFCVHQKKVCEERKAQIAFNEELKRQKLIEEQMFSKLWEEDRLAKEKREAEEARRQKELVENTRLGLDAQITSIKAQRRAAQQLKEEEARFVENDKAQVKLENEQDKLKKWKTKQELRAALQKALLEKTEHIQQECREEQDLNMKLLQRALQDLQDEADKKKQKKEEMAREQEIYRQYLAQRREEERAQEKQLDRILEAEKEKKLAEKDKELRLEKEARRQLVNEVMCTRKLQVQEKLQRKAKEQEERAMEQERINEGLEELNREEKENFARRSSLAREYRKQLEMQMSYQQQAREAEKEEERREFEAGVAANKICQDKIWEILSVHPVLSRNTHPMRRACPDQLPP
ncbi:methyl-CpG-binding domain protein 1 isoform X3 [Hyaena hyaena]|uniref:methyl-CpG-binding domain protein 1 isoform X3 n=1 Tax=Hyaena hyaena TaxID=95912 RepID=UPI001923510D|nr:methyl-CpG-binding domain protein 1 isoform X3 [Hyaena hyaena]